MRRQTWIDSLVYRLFVWRWKPLLAHRPDLREMMISYLKAFDVLDDGSPIRVRVVIEPREQEPV